MLGALLDWLRTVSRRESRPNCCDEKYCIIRPAAEGFATSGDRYGQAEEAGVFCGQGGEGERAGPRGTGAAGTRDSRPETEGRYQDIYSEPRTVIERQATLVEAPRNHERSFCCGAGGGLAFLGEEKGDARVSHVRARELAATGAQTVATACPFCNTMFRDALTAITPADATPPQLLDIAQLTARALPQPQPPQN